MKRKEWKKNSFWQAVKHLQKHGPVAFFNDSFGELGDAPANRGFPMRHAVVTVARRAHNAAPDGLSTTIFGELLSCEYSCEQGLQRLALQESMIFATAFGPLNYKLSPMNPTMLDPRHLN